MDRIYLDHNATTPVHPRVIDAMLPFFRGTFGNPSSVHQEGRAARVSVDEAREHVASLIGAEPGEIIFTSGGTEANNLALLGTALASKERRHIITCAVEHPSVLNPLKQLGPEFQIQILPVDRWGQVSLDSVRDALTEATLMVSLQHGNSEVGTLQDIETIGEFLHERGVMFHTDAVQSAGKLPLDVSRLPVDMLSLSAHKLYGPKGVGALFLRRGANQLFSTMAGGNQERKRRGGTENVPGIAGFGVACALARERLAQGGTDRLRALRNRLRDRIGERIPGVVVLGHPESLLPNTLSCGFPHISGDALLIGLDMEGVAVSAGTACSSGSPLPSHVLTAMQVDLEQVPAVVRFSLGWENTEEQVDRVVEILERCMRFRNEEVSPEVT
ncbi:MAG: cysteine desulfurase NifS [Nitrospinae bacterium CG11_big_fil_rev_8_21_14_0_20_56_8]|nr:MAG: cysteine desulfurase NifS [Nitrospinae bacterium CG11_big_fil_rev_8_21_14_0_20_56_8]